MRKNKGNVIKMLFSSPKRWCKHLVGEPFLCVVANVTFWPRHGNDDEGTEQATVDGPTRHFLDGGQSGLDLYFPLGGDGSHLLGLGLALALIHHAAGCLVVAGSHRLVHAVVFLCIACDIVLLSVLEHVSVKGRSYARSYYHAHREHYANPC